MSAGRLPIAAVDRLMEHEAGKVARGGAAVACIRMAVAIRFDRLSVTESGTQTESLSQPKRSVQ